MDPVGLLAAPRWVRRVGGIPRKSAPTDRVFECAVDDRVHVVDGAAVEPGTSRRPRRIRFASTQQRGKGVLRDVLRLSQLRPKLRGRRNQRQPCGAEFAGPHENCVRVAGAASGRRSSTGGEELRVEPVQDASVDFRQPHRTDVGDHVISDVAGVGVERRGPHGVLDRTQPVGE